MAEHVNEIVETVFQYLALMRSKGPQRTLFQECAVSDQTSTVCLTREVTHTIVMATLLQGNITTRHSCTAG